MKILKTLFFVSLTALWACEDVVPYPGENGGDCRIALEPCNEGLECRAGACRTPDDAPPPPQVALIFDIERTTLTPDGADLVLITLLASHADDSDPYEGEMLLQIDPPEAGTLRPALVPFDQGIGFTEYIACNRSRDRVCPDVIRLTAALRDTPLSPFAVSEDIRLTTAAAPEAADTAEP